MAFSEGSGETGNLVQDIFGSLIFPVICFDLQDKSLALWEENGESPDLGQAVSCVVVPWPISSTRNLCSLGLADHLNKI